MSDEPERKVADELLDDLCRVSTELRELLAAEHSRIASAPLEDRLPRTARNLILRVRMGEKRCNQLKEKVEALTIERDKLKQDNKELQETLEMLSTPFG